MLLARALVQQRRAVGRGVQHGGDRGQVVVVDDDELGGVGGALRRVGDDQDDRLAGPQHLVAGEHRVRRVQRARRQALAAGERADAELRQVGGGEDGGDACRLAGLGDVDAR